MDGLCGVYATINAVKLISDKLSAEKWQEIFLKILKLQIKQRKTVVFLILGLNETNVARILQKIISPKFDITYSRPFETRKKVSMDNYWHHIHAFLNGQDGRSAIICYETKNKSHWTAVAYISLNRLYLFDSAGKKAINRKQCTTTEISKATPILIRFTATFYLEAV